MNPVPVPSAATLPALLGEKTMAAVFACLGPDSDALGMGGTARGAPGTAAKSLWLLSLPVLCSTPMPCNGSFREKRLQLVKNSYKLSLELTEGTRTPDRLITNQMLYQLSYASLTSLQWVKRVC